MNSSIPVTLLGGYLGSGKTTLVNNLLRHANGQRLAILVNDFGELPIDAALIEVQEGDIISLSGGCVCCSYGNDLTMALLNLLELRGRPDQVVVESSGVALPGAIARSLTLLDSFTTEGIIVLADATTVMTHAKDRYLADTISRQLRDADVVILNKAALSNSEQIDACINWMENEFPQARIVRTNYAAVPNAVVLGASAGNYSAERVNTANKSEFVHDAALFSSIEIALPATQDVKALAASLADKKCGLVRAKGFVQDATGSMKTVQVVGQRWSVTDAPEGVSSGIVCIGITGQFTEQSVLRFCAQSLAPVE